MLTRRSAAKVLARQQNGRAFVSRLMQNKVRVLLPVRSEAPVIKQKLPKAGLLDPLQKLLRNNLVGIDVHPIQRRHAPAMHSKRFHPGSTPSPRGCPILAAFCAARVGILTCSEAHPFTQTSNSEYP